MAIVVGVPIPAVLWKRVLNGNVYDRDVFGVSFCTYFLTALVENQMCVYDFVFPCDWVWIPYSYPCAAMIIVLTNTSRKY
jgi:hypothetical protein